MKLNVVIQVLLSSVARKHLFTLLWVLIFSGMATAQDSAFPPSQGADIPGIPGRYLDAGTSQLGFWSGYSPDNPTLMGRKKNRPYGEFDVHYARVLRTGATWALKYTAEIIPLAIIRQPQQGLTMKGNPKDLPGSKQKVYGTGAAPVGLQMNFRRGSVLQPYINVTAGVLYFKEQVPVINSSKFNFAFGLGAGVEIWHREDQSILLGYKYHHISNVYTSRQNPGVDSNLFYAGYAWSRR